MINMLNEEGSEEFIIVKIEYRTIKEGFAAYDSALYLDYQNQFGKKPLACISETGGCNHDKYGNEIRPKTEPLENRYRNAAKKMQHLVDELLRLAEELE